MQTQQQVHQDICVSIRGICESHSLPEFFINGYLTQWPQSDNTQYNVAYSPSSREYSFCFINITENITISEFCYQHHLASCSLCSIDTGERYFLSHSNIFIIAVVEGKLSQMSCIQCHNNILLCTLIDINLYQVILMNQLLALFHHQHLVTYRFMVIIINFMIIIYHLFCS